MPGHTRACVNALSSFVVWSSREETLGKETTLIQKFIIEFQADFQDAKTYPKGFTPLQPF